MELVSRERSSKVENISNVFIDKIIESECFLEEDFLLEIASDH